MRGALLLLLLSPGSALSIRIAPAVRRPTLTVLRTKAPTNLALPTCTAAGVVTVAARAGIAGAIAQCGLWAIFQKSSDPILCRAPGYSAHSALALCLMVFCATFGLAGWLSPPASAMTAAGRLLMPSGAARWLGATLLGLLLAWDIPTCLWIGRLRKPDMLGHHVAMALTALVGATALPTHYVRDRDPSQPVCWTRTSRFADHEPHSYTQLLRMRTKHHPFSQPLRTAGFVLYGCRRAVVHSIDSLRPV